MTAFQPVASGGQPTVNDAILSASVVVAAYTMDRWQLLTNCMESVLAQTLAPREVVLCIDTNEELFELAQRTWGSRLGVEVLRGPADESADAALHEAAHGVRRRFGAGAARNAAITRTSADVVAIIDDDACADPDWLQRLIDTYTSPGVVAVGGAPVALYETERPSWFPRSFDWVFGCQYQGLPVTIAPSRRLIGANMSFRRAAFDTVGGFQSIDFDDLDLCMRLGHEYGHGALLYNPAARVHHFVSAERVTWHYFWKRCFHVNAAKVKAFEDMQDAASLRAEVGFALQTLTRGVGSELARVLRGDFAGLSAGAAIVCGLALAAAGNVWGRYRSAAVAR